MTETRLHDSLVEQDDPVPYRAAEGLRITAPSKGQRGARNYVVRAPSGDLCQLGEEEHFLLTMLDGKRSFAEIAREFQARFDENLSRHHFRSFVDELQSAGIILAADREATAAASEPALPVEAEPPQHPDPDGTGEVVPAVEAPVLYPTRPTLAPLFEALARLGSPLRYFSWFLIPAPVLAGILLYGHEPAMRAALSGVGGGLAAFAAIGALAALLLPNLVRGAAASFHGAPRQAFRLTLAGYVVPWFRIDRGWIGTLPPNAQVWTYGAPLLARLAEFAIGAALWRFSDNPASPLAVAALAVGGVGLWSFLLTATPLWASDGRRWLAVRFDNPVFNGPLLRILRRDRSGGEVRGRALVAATAIISVTGMLGAVLLWGEVAWHALALLLGSARDLASPAIDSAVAVAGPWLDTVRAALGPWFAPWLAPVEEAVSSSITAASDAISTAAHRVGAAWAAAASDGILRESGAALLGGSYVAGLAWLGRTVSVTDTLQGPGRGSEGARAHDLLIERSGGGVIPMPRDLGSLPPSLDRRLAVGGQEWPSNIKVLVVALLLAFALSVAFLSYPYESGGTFTILPNDQYDVRARVSGEIAEVLVAEGEQVKPGQLVATLGDWKETHNLDVAKATLEKASAQLQDLLLLPKPEQVAVARQQYEQAASRLTFSKAEYERDLALVQTGAVSLRQFEQSQSSYEQDKAAVAVTRANYDMVRVGATQPEIEAARASVRLAAAQVRYAEEQLERARIRAPAAGTVVTPNPQLTKGKYLKEGDLFVQIQDRGVARVEVQVPESDIREIQVGSRVRAKAWGYEHTTWFGKVILIAPDAQPNQALGNIVRVVADIPNPDGKLRPHMSGYAKVRTAEMPVWESFTRALARFVLVEMWSWVP